MTTVGGVAFRHLDRLPKEGDRVTVEGFMIKVLEMDGHRIARVRVSRGSAAEDDDSSKSENSADIESADSSHGEPFVAETDKPFTAIGSTSQGKE